MPNNLKETKCFSMSDSVFYSIRFLIIFVFLVSTAIAGNVSLDQTFNGTGYRIQFINVDGSIGESVKVQTDGKIVLGGWTLSPAVFGAFAAMRVNSNGTLDTGFDGDGFVTTQVANFNRGEELLIQSDGKILLSGERYFGSSNNDFTILRYNLNGSLDNSFDGNGVAAPVVNGFSDEHSYDMALQPDGKMILVGTTAPTTTIDQTLPTDIAIMRINTNGSLDTTFNGTGILVISFQNVSESANAVLIQPDGKIVIGGFLFTGIKNEYLLMRFNPNGTLDTSFGSNGITITSVSVGSNSIKTMALQSDGKIIAGGSNYLARYTTAGILDNTFGNNGVRAASHSVNEILVQNGNKFLVAGTSGSSVAVSRYSSDGIIDTSFNNSGTVAITVPGSQCVGSSIDVQNDGKLIIGGDCTQNNRPQFAIFRLQESVQGKAYDYDGDSKADVSIFRPSVAGWYVSRSSDNAFFGTTFGNSTDLIAPADFDGDGKTDISVFRQGNWYRINSSNNSFSAVSFGIAEDLPVPADFDGDGKADISVYRPSTGNWYRLNSSNNSFSGVAFGTTEDKPTIGDFDGDGKADIAVFRPSTGSWYRLNSSNGAFAGVSFGLSTDKIVPADYDGDGKTDVAVFRPSNGTWYRLNSSNGEFVGTAFGSSEDTPTAADFDGDGKADVGVFRPSNGTWYLNRSTNGFTAQTFGSNGDIPTPNAFVR